MLVAVPSMLRQFVVIDLDIGEAATWAASELSLESLGKETPNLGRLVSDAIDPLLRLIRRKCLCLLHVVELDDDEPLWRSAIYRGQLLGAGDVLPACLIDAIRRFGLRPLAYRLEGLRIGDLCDVADEVNRRGPLSAQPLHGEAADDHSRCYGYCNRHVYSHVALP